MKTDLSSRQRALVALSVAVAARDEEALEEALRRALADAPPEEVEEALLQTQLFLGYPAALDALARWRAVRGGPPAEADTLTQGSAEAWRARGEAVCQVVYGEAYAKLRANISRAHPAMERWMLMEGYGKVLGRASLDLPTRELCIAAMLAAEGWLPQLHSHLRGALRAGASEAEVEAALELGLGAARRPERCEPARQLFERLRPSRHPRGEA